MAPGVQVSSDIPDLQSESDDSPLPVAVIASKAVARGSSITTNLLIQWDGLPSSLATWEEYHDLRRRFPAAPAYGQARFKGGGNVIAHMGCMHSG